MRASRRSFLKWWAGGMMGALVLGRLPRLEAATAEPHFFLFLLLEGGADWSYLFDARPLSFTAANWLQNYTRAEPYRWEGSNGQGCWASEVTRPLLPYRNDFSIINGLMMSPTFDGHEQNTNLMMSGNVFGGEFYLPALDRTGLIDAVQKDPFRFPSLTNTQKMVGLTGPLAFNLIQTLGSSSSVLAEDSDITFVRDRAHKLSGTGTSAFAQGAGRLEHAVSVGARLDDLLRPIVVSSNDSAESFLDFSLANFKQGMTNCAALNLSDTLLVDAHGVSLAQTQPQAFSGIVSKIRNTIDRLKTTPFDATRSFFDVTTFVVCSEFSRTMRQVDRKIDDTGTDHNPLNNSVLIGGKGILGGQVLGESDFQTLDEPWSGAHLQVDADKLKFLARPFDFATMRPRPSAPNEFVLEDYLSPGSIVNTLYSVFEVPKYRYWKIGQSGQVAPVLTTLLKRS